MKKLITLRLPAILASLILIAGLISLTWESGTSYDDGGLGTFSFIILMPIMHRSWTQLHLRGRLAKM